MLLREGITLRIPNRLKDSDFLIKKCGEESSPFLAYKRKNFMNEQAKTQREIVDKLRIKIKFRKEELLAAKKHGSARSSAAELNKDLTLQDVIGSKPEVP